MSIRSLQIQLNRIWLLILKVYATVQRANIVMCGLGLNLISSSSFMSKGFKSWTNMENLNKSSTKTEPSTCVAFFTTKADIVSL